MNYKGCIISAITEQSAGKPNGPSLTIIRNHVEKNLLTDIKWSISAFLRKLKTMVNNSNMR